MATPDYLQQVIVSGRRTRGTHARSTVFGIFRRPSVTSLVWASLDLLTVLVAGVLAVRLHVAIPYGVPVYKAAPLFIAATPHALVLYLAWYALCVVFFTRS